MKLQIHGKPSRKWAAMASATHSAKHGENARRMTAKESFFSAAGSRPKPARIKIIVRAICLQLEKSVLSVCNEKLQRYLSAMRNFSAICLQ
ncbi:hypothetical protein DPMN_025758 [Dreissena polymorpha]|uniref:Uncharacterized protein n=1 Tax=Dreissena polymorpha TaxID=45954 RepID=A0A9D4RC46_DREPO|nr:hypothetical protein DPMN_025758 [Dreissena polymorpha]